MIKPLGAYKVWMCSLCMLVLILPGLVHAGLITNLTVQSADLGSNAGMGPEKAINGSGLPNNTPALSGGHRVDWDKHWWGPDTDSSPQITIDLGGEYVVETIHVWNYNESAATKTRGLKEVDIYVSPDTNAVNLVKLGTTGDGTHDYLGHFQFPQAGGTNDYPGFELDLSGITNAFLLAKVRLIQIQALNNWGNTKGAGLAEVQFGGTLYIPPPLGTVIIVK